MLRGLVKDSAVIGTYKRLHRKPKRKNYQAEINSVYFIIDAIKRFNVHHSKRGK